MDLSLLDIPPPQDYSWIVDGITCKSLSSGLSGRVFVDGDIIRIPSVTKVVYPREYFVKEFELAPKN